MQSDQPCHLDPALGNTPSPKPSVRVPDHMAPGPLITLTQTQLTTRTTTRGQRSGASGSRARHPLGLCPALRPHSLLLACESSPANREEPEPRAQEFLSKPLRRPRGAAGGGCRHHGNPLTRLLLGFPGTPAQGPRGCGVCGQQPPKGPPHTTPVACSPRTAALHCSPPPTPTPHP